MSHRHPGFWAAIVLTGTACLTAQTPAAQSQPEPTFRSGVNEILVDVVVRDKKGRLIQGLKQSDVAILEDGVPQTITLFREVRSAGVLPQDREPQVQRAGEIGATGDTGKVYLSRQIRLVSLVFERLGPEGRRLARQAAFDFLKRDLGANVYYAIFWIDRDFKVLQAYTNDQERLRAAITRATGGERSDFGNDTAALDRTQQQTQGSAGAAAAVAAGAAGGAMNVDGGALSSEQANRIAGEMREFAALVTREELSRVSVFSLWAIIRELERLPGRKSVLYFAEGLQLPNGLWEQFHSMISAANRANVSVYAIDARGLQAGGDSAMSQQMLATATERSRWARSTQTEDAVGQRAESRTFDLAMDSIRANQQVALAELAESTGGLLMANTNDFRPFLKKLSDDFNTYYEITYRPANPAYDGRFRPIEVKVNRPDTVLQARNGYFALPPMDGQTVYPYEVPLLHALGRNPLPRDLEFRAGVLQFRPRESMQEALLVFDLPLKNIAFAKDESVGKYRTHISVMSLVKDSEGHVVEKLSRDVPLNEPIDKLAGFQQGRFIVTRPLRLAPGRYTVESIAADQQGQKLAAKRSVVVVQNRAQGPQLSELSLVRRLDKPAEFRDILDPLQLPQGKVVPTLVDTIKGGAGSMLSVFFVLYPTSSLPEKPRLVLDLVKEGKVLSRATPALPAPDDLGVIPYIANTPLDQLAPGQYEFRATIAQGTQAAQRSLFVTIE